MINTRTLCLGAALTIVLALLTTYEDCVAQVIQKNQNGDNNQTTNNYNAPKTYRFCFGEYERACQAHDIYMYCYEKPNGWVAAHCDPDSKIVGVTGYGGNKCGYSIMDVVCKNPH
jgi:hypothetical protein